MSSLRETASWVIREKATGRVLFETFSAPLAATINRAVYEAVPILRYLQELNAGIRQAAREAEAGEVA